MPEHGGRLDSNDEEISRKVAGFAKKDEGIERKVAGITRKVALITRKGSYVTVFLSSHGDVGVGAGANAYLVESETEEFLLKEVHHRGPILVLLRGPRRRKSVDLSCNLKTIYNKL